MRTSVELSYPLLIMVLATVACGPAETPQEEVPVATAAATVLDAFLESGTAWNAADTAAVAAGLADDMVQLQPDIRLVGKQAVLANWLPYLAANTHSWTNTAKFVHESGGFGFVLWTFTGWFAPKAGGDTTKSEGLMLDVFRREPDGSWKQVFESWYTPPIQVLKSLPGRGPLTAQADSVKRVFDQYVKDWNAADLDAVGARLDDGVVQMLSDTSYVGKDTLLAVWRKLLAENADVWSPTVLDVQVAGDLAYLMFSGEEVQTPKAGGAARTDVQVGWEVFRRSDAGEWKLVNESFFNRPR